MSRAVSGQLIQNIHKQGRIPLDVELVVSDLSLRCCVLI